MILTRTTSYALRILIFMGSHETDTFTAKDLYHHLKIPDRYLRRLLTGLANKGFIRSLQGRKGGYILGKTPDKICLADIIDATEGMQSMSFCILGVQGCSMSPKCVMHDLWEDVKSRMIATFSETTLQDLKSKGVVI